MKKISIIILATFFTLTPVMSQTWEVLSNTCQNRFSFFGLVEVWSGSITYGERDAFGNPTGNKRTEQCTSDGNWDWAW